MKRYIPTAYSTVPGIGFPCPEVTISRTPCCCMPNHSGSVKNMLPASISVSRDSACTPRQGVNGRKGETRRATTTTTLYVFKSEKEESVYTARVLL